MREAVYMNGDPVKLVFPRNGKIGEERKAVRVKY